MTRPLDISNPHVRQVITPDGVAEFVFPDSHDPKKVWVNLKTSGRRKITDFRKYSTSELQEVEK
jgi:hypothetical protein